MLLVIDVGNTNIVLGVYDKKNLVGHWRISTDRVRTTDEYGMLMMNLFFHVEAVRTLLGASGQRPSEAKVQQVYRQIVNQQKSAMAKNKKK